MSYIFISYSRENTSYAEQLSEYLMTAGFDVWFDDRNDETLNLVEAVQKSAIVLFLMSTKGGESRWMQRELAAAVQKSKPYYPLLLDGRPWILLRGTPYTDVTDAKLPGNNFLDNLTLHLPRKLSKGKNLAPQKGVSVSPDIPSVTTMMRPDGFKELASLLYRARKDDE